MVASNKGNHVHDTAGAAPSTLQGSVCCDDVLQKLEAGQRQLLEKVDLQLQRFDEILQRNLTGDLWQGGYRGPVSPLSDGAHTPSAHFQRLPSLVSGKDSSAKTGAKDLKVKDLKAYQNAAGWNKIQESAFPVDKNEDLVTRFASGPCWTFLCIFVILASTVVVGIETQLDMGHAVDQALSSGGDAAKANDLDKTVFTVVEMAVLAWMIFEVLLNAYAQKWDFFCGKDARWNLFDVFVVLLSVAMIIAQSASVSFLRVTRVARLFRMGKVLRAFRVAKFLRSVRNMLISMSGSMMHLLSAIFVMCTFMFVISLTMMQGIANELQVLPQASFEPGFIENIDKLYGSLLKTMLTLFRSITSGLDWSQAAATVGELSVFYEVIWVCYIAFMTFGLLNVLVGIFVEAAMSSMLGDKEYMIQLQQEERDSLISAIAEIFVSSPRDDQSYIVEEDLNTMLEDPELLAYFSALGLDSTEAKGLFALLDDDHSGAVGIDEFVTGFLRLKGNAKSVDLLSLIYENKKVIKHLHHIYGEVMTLQTTVKVLWQEKESDSLTV